MVKSKSQLSIENNIAKHGKIKMRQKQRLKNIFKTVLFDFFEQV